MTCMSMQWGNRRWLRATAFIGIGLAALYLGLLSPMQRKAPRRQVTALAESSGSFSANLTETKSRMRLGDETMNGEPRAAAGVVGGIPGGVPKNLTIANAEQITVANADRMIVRNGSLALIVAHPAASVEEIVGIAERHGGYVVSSQVGGQKERETGQVIVRVPAAQFDAVRTELKKLAQTVETEQVSADDVTMQYSEDEATLRNYRAEEASYLEIMKRSGRIKDTLEVAEQLSDVRGRIERMTAGLQTMQHQVEMTALTVSLRTEPIAVTNQWRPLYELKLAWNEGTSALADYATTMMAVMFYLPSVIAWILTLALAAKLGWMLLRLGIRLFYTPKTQPAAS